MAHRLRLRRPGAGAEDRRRARLRLRPTASRASGAPPAPSRASPSQHGGADWDTRSMIHTIGVSFTAEMLAKAAYEETIGRATAWLRGPRKTPQDAVVAGDGRRLRGVPAPDAVVPVSVQSQGARALGRAGRAVRSRMGAAPRHRAGVRGEGRVREGPCRCGGRHRRRRSWSSAASSSGSTPRPSRAFPASPWSARAGTASRSRRRATIAFTRILADIARQGGAIREIAGNDEIMVSVTVREARRRADPAWNRAPAHEA